MRASFPQRDDAVPHRADQGRLAGMTHAAPVRARTAYLEATSPCIEALMDMRAVREYVEANGFIVVDSAARADVVFVQTCAVDQLREDRAAAQITGLKGGLRPEQELVVTGCMVKINPERLGRIHQGPAVAPSKMAQLDTLLDATVSIEEFDPDRLDDDYVRNIPVVTARAYRRLLQGAAGVDARAGTRLRERLNRTVHYHPLKQMGFLRVGKGCLGHCAFCAIKHARGHLQSMAPDRIEQSLRRQLDQGRRFFYIVATDAGAYGLDIGTDLAELLQRLLAVDADFELGIDYLSPDHLVRMWPRLRPLMADRRVRFACVPVQSGSQAVLDRMIRPYRADEVAACLAELAEAAPQCVIKGIFMVGHPGEGRDEFRESKHLVATTPFHNLTVLTYTPRPGTRSSRWPDEVPEREKQRRRYELFGWWAMSRGLRRVRRA